MRIVLIALTLLAALGCPAAQALHEAGHWAEHEAAYVHLLALGTSSDAPADPDSDEARCAICQSFSALSLIADVPDCIAAPKPTCAYAEQVIAYGNDATAQQRRVQPPARGPPGARFA